MLHRSQRKRTARGAALGLVRKLEPYCELRVRRCIEQASVKNGRFQQSDRGFSRTEKNWRKRYRVPLSSTARTPSNDAVGVHRKSSSISTPLLPHTRISTQLPNVGDG